MKKIFLMMTAGMLGLLIVGCATLPITKHQSVLPKVNKVFVDDKVEVYKEVEGAWTLKKRFKNRVDNVDPYYQELAEVYVKGLRKELVENSFEVVDKPDSHSLIVRTKIENQPPSLTGILIGGALGAVIAVHCRQEMEEIEGGGIL
jgi:hypothetical protein